MLIQLSRIRRRRHHTRYGLTVQQTVVLLPVYNNIEVSHTSEQEERSAYATLKLRNQSHAELNMIFWEATYAFQCVLVLRHPV